MNRLLAASTIAALCVVGLAAAPQPRSRTVYITVVDKGGVPVPDLKPSDLIVTEDGQDRQSLTVQRASAPMKVAVIVDEGELWSSPVRASLNSIAQAMQGSAD